MPNIGTAPFYSRSVAGLSTLRAQADRLQTQISTGDRLQRASDDPAAARVLRQLATADARAGSFNANSGVAASDLALADSAMDELSNLTIQAQELVTQATTGTINADQRKAIGAQLAEIHTAMVEILNNRDSTGASLFGGGTNTGDAYAVDAAGNAVYAGSGAAASIEIGEGFTVTRSLTGPEFLNFDVAGTPSDLLSVVKGLADTLKSNAPDAAAQASAMGEGLKTGITTLATARAVIGARAARVETAQTLAIEQGETRAADQIRLGETDYNVALAQLQQTMLVLEASQQSFAKIGQLSLFDYIR